MYDLIIVDYHMPDMDGLEVIKRIRMMLAGKSDSQPIIMLHSSSDDLVLHEKAKELNVRYLLTKPVKQDELYYYVNSLNNTENIDTLPEYVNQNPVDNDFKDSKDKSFNVLVAEDTAMNMLVIRNMLKSLLTNVQILEASNGLEAIQLMKNNKPDIVLMDVQMPELDGLEATRQIRKIKNGLSVPIIALTAGVSKEEREHCFASGMDDFLSKPIERNELKRITQKYLMKVEQSVDNELVDTSIGVVFNREKLLSKIGSVEILQNLIDMSKSEYPKYIAEIAYAIDLEDETLIKQKAHKLKGSALNMEFEILGEVAKIIEQNATNSTVLKSLLLNLEEAWNKLLNELN